VTAPAVDRHRTEERTVSRQLVITQNITVDGVVEASDGWFGPDNNDDAEDMLAVMREHMARDVGFLVGRCTFEDVRGYWPARTDDTTGITAHLDAVAKYVVSTTIDDPAWAPTTVLRGGAGLADEVAAVLADGPDGDVTVTGSISLCHALLAAGLVDELRLFVFPVVLGRGRRLFGDGTGLGRLDLVEHRAFASGIVLQSYRRR
jgi:dihydrofolate reductase